MDKFKASMVLSAVGDALGYKNGQWEFNYDGQDIHRQLEVLGGITKLIVNKEDWMVSDDTMLHIATGEELSCDWPTKEELYFKLSKRYKEVMKDDMWGRAPGATIQSSVQLFKDTPGGYIIPFNPRGGGCGASMRSMCIGLLFYRPEHLDDLIAVSIESGRMTHNHPTGYLGSMVAALFTSYAIQGKPIREWGAGLMATLPRALEYVEKTGRDVPETRENWSYFTNKWTDYLTKRGILDGIKEPVFPEKYTVVERDEFYTSISFQGWGGASGHDAPMIAYDALLGAGGSWEELCLRGMFHGGDSDSTGVIAGAWFGALYGLDGVPEVNYSGLEFKERIEGIAERLYHKSEQLESLKCM